MKTSKPIIYYLPSKAIQELQKQLSNNPPSFNYKIDCFYYLIHDLMFIELRNNKYEYHKLDINRLKLATVSNIQRYLYYLVSNKIFLTEKAIPKVKKTYYKINPDMFVSWQEVKIFPDSVIHSKIIASQKLKNNNHYKLPEYLLQMRNKIKSINYNYDKAKDYVFKYIDYSKQPYFFSSIQNLHDKRFLMFKRNRTNNRLDTNFTTLPKRLRGFVVGDYVNIDLCNSQPIFLFILINNIINNNITILNTIPLCNKNKKLNFYETFGKRAIDKILKIHKKQEIENNMNFRKYQEAVLSGKLYDNFCLRNPDVKTRDEAKDIIFEILFSKNESYQQGKKKFKAVYQFINECVIILKQKDHKQLSIYLQSLESYVFIDCIAQELVNKNIIPITIHDSIFIERTHQEKVKNTIISTFKNLFNVVPPLKVE